MWRQRNYFQMSLRSTCKRDRRATIPQCYSRYRQSLRTRSWTHSPHSFQMDCLTCQSYQGWCPWRDVGSSCGFVWSLWRLSQCGWSHLIARSFNLNNFSNQPWCFQMYQILSVVHSQLEVLCVFKWSVNVFGRECRETTAAAFGSPRKSGMT